LPGADKAELSWEADLPLAERPWNIGLIVGPSGSGKSTVARAIFGEAFAASDRLPGWPEQASVLDGFPTEMPVKEIVALLSSVGFSSPPAWLRPFRVLSTGEQFRVNLARLLACQTDLVVMDEYTSVVDRIVAQIGSAAVARTVRRLGRRFVAVTCHEDVESWLQPDWIYRPTINEFSWRCLQPRPPIELTIFRARLEAWQLFRAHHYLSSGLSPSSCAFLAAWSDRPVAFSAWVGAFTKHGGKREHRTVTLPDYQGVGIGHALSEFCASLWLALGHRAVSTTTHPAFIAARLKSSRWRLRRAPSLASASGNRRGLKHALSRLTAGFEYIGPPLDRGLAQRLINGNSGKRVQKRIHS
jgi:energy-coupling factor transporter ATP-binding protein EcfA2/GNAT superfamily N-acetyltransferase